MKLLTLTPTWREAAAIPGERVVCGSGPRARIGVQSHLDRNAVRVIIVAGTCGGLDPSLATGDSILATHVVSPGRADLRPDAELLEWVRRELRATGRRFVSSTLLTLDRPAGSRVRKTDLWNAHGAAGVDMETYDLVDAAMARGIRWIALRSVLDPAGSGLPAPLLDWRDELDERAILRRLAARPATWPAVARLALRMRRAHAALTHSVPVVAGAARSFDEHCGGETSDRATRE